MNNHVFFAFATGKESTEGVSIKRYIGMAPVFVLAVNPTKEELSKLYNTEIEKDLEYLGESEVGLEGAKKKVSQVRLDFIVQTDPTKCNGIDIKTKVSFFLKKEMRYNKDETKVQVINKYGETTWLLVEDAKKGVVPENLSWFEPADFRPAYIGEEELTGFIKAYLNIPNKSYKKKTGEIVELPNKADAEARLDNIQEYFKGNYKELKTVLSLQPNNKVKCCFGVKTTDDGKQYQTIYSKFIKNNVTNYTTLEKELDDKKSNGYLTNSEFSVCDLKEFVVESTDFSATTTDQDPFASPISGDSPWGFNN